MENNLINILMETDPKKLERNTKTDIEIARLSEIFGTPFLVTVKAIEGDRYTELASGTLMDDDGKVDFSRSYKANLMIAIDGIVSPDIKNRELQKHFGCASPKDLMETLFNGGEVTKIADEITELSGYSNDAAKKVKNSSTRTEK